MIGLPVLSATQISLFTECERKWGFKYLDRVQVPQKPGAELGQDVQDNQLDPYLGTGRGFDFTKPSGEIANALTPLLPRPKAPGMRLRRKFWMPSPTGRFSYQGEFDLWAPDSSIVPGLVGGRPLLGDIKCIKDLQYAKDTEALAVDIQQNLYAAALMFYEDGGDELDAVWFWARTRKPHRVQRTHLRVLASRTADEFGRIDTIGREVAAIKWQSPKANELKPTGAIPHDGRTMCESYGGCPYSFCCDLSPKVQAEAINQGAIMEAKTNDFLANLRKNSAPPPMQPAPPPAPAANPFAPPAPSALPPWATAPVDPMVARHEAAKAPVVMPPASVAVAGSVVGVTPGGAVLLQTPAINPPESALPPAPPIGAAAPAEAKAKRGRPAAAPKPTSERTPGYGFDQLEGLAAKMRELGVRKVTLVGSELCEVELAP